MLGIDFAEYTNQSILEVVSQFPVFGTKVKTMCPNRKCARQEKNAVKR